MTEQRSLRIGDLGIRPIPGMTMPSQVAFSSDSLHLYYLAPDDDGRLALFVFDIVQGAERRVLAAPTFDGAHDSLEEELRKQRLRQTLGGIGGFELLDDSCALVNIAGERRVIHLDDGGPVGAYDFSDIQGLLRRTPESFVGTTGREIVQLFADGNREVIAAVAGDTMTIGVAEYVAQEELDRMTGLWLDPTGRYLAYTEVDESRVPEHLIVRSDVHPNQIERYRYPFVGADNATVVLCVFDLETRSRSVIGRYGSDAYLGNVVWLDAENLCVSSLNRAQDHLSRWLWRVSTGTTTLLAEERGDPWVNLAHGEFSFGGALITSSEAGDGFRRLIRIEVDGTNRAVGDAVIRDVLGVAGTWALVVATGEDNPTQEWLWRVDLTTDQFERLATGSGAATGVLSPDGNATYVSASSVFSPPRAAVFAPGLDVEIRRGTPPFALIPPELFTLTSASQEVLHGAVYLPPEDCIAGAPLIVSVYGGPHAQLVRDTYDLTLDLQAQFLASCGAVVVKLDNRGSYGRGRQFEAHLRGRFGAVELADQLQAVAFCQQRYGLDPDRVGIYGWSYGGYMTLVAMTQAPEVFTVGVAGAPVVDFRWYDTAYTERYLGDPEVNREGYDRSSVLGGLDGLRGRLLVIHGMADENVHLGHTSSLLQRANELGKTIDLVLLPGSRHAPVDPASLARVATARSEYLLRHLGLSTQALRTS